METEDLLRSREAESKDNLDKQMNDVSQRFQKELALVKQELKEKEKRLEVIKLEMTEEMRI